MTNILLLFPHQLFEHIIDSNDRFDQIYLLEDPLYFGTDSQYPTKFHKQKLMLHRASMQAYYKRLPASKSHYINFEQIVEGLKDVLPKQGTLYFYDVVDFELRRRIQELPHKQHELPSPNFLLHREDLDDYFDSGKQLFNTFYVRRRKELGILLKENDKPIGGKWSFDAENRRKLAASVIVPDLPHLEELPEVVEARQYVKAHFPDNPGEVTTFRYPINHQQSRAWLQMFLDERLHDFGPYEDAIVPEQHYMFHSVITPMLNIGLLNPREVMEAVLDFAESKEIPLSSLEGYIRQIIGWREYMRGMYETQGVSMRTTNYFSHQRQLSDAWYDGSTGMKPFDDVVKKIMQTGYAHHIERLMVAGNLMLLSRLHPNQVYRWFMELFVDSYDWVMVPNIYGMSQFADGGNMVTKPYISGSNYMRKMSDYKSGEWQEIWDGLYWKFIDDHRSLFKSNQRMSMMTTLLDRMDGTKKDRIFAAAEKFINEKTLD